MYTLKCNYASCAVEFVKSNLSFIDTVTSFEIYNNEEIPEKYHRVEYNNERNKIYEHTKYSLILRNDTDGREIWLSGPSCGPEASGGRRSDALEILRILGIGIEYERLLTESKVIENRLMPNLNLNLVIYRDDVCTYKKEIFSIVKIPFQTTYQKYLTRESFEKIGQIIPLGELDFEIDDVRNILKIIPYSKKDKLYGYTINCGLMLKKPYSELENEAILEIIKDIINTTCKESKPYYEIEEYKPKPTNDNGHKTKANGKFERIR